MSPNLPNRQQGSPRHRVIEVMTRAQEDAMAQLRRDGIPETQALLVMQRISSLCLQTLRELDRVYQEFEELLAQDPDRSQAHQEWLDTKAGGMLLTLEAMITALVAEAINKAKEDYRAAISQPREVIALPPKPSRPGWMSFLLTTTSGLVWLAGMVSGLLLAWQLSGEFVLAGFGLLLPVVLWRMVGRFWWGLVVPFMGIGLEAWALYWIAIVEGGLQ